MRSKEKKTTVFLTGGLGNQLFELAAGLSVVEDGIVYYESEIGKPRKNKNGQIQIECFSLPENLRKLEKQSYSWFFSKVYGYTLRSGFSPNKYERNLMYRGISFGVAQVMLSIYLKQWNTLQVGTDVGYTELDKNLDQSALVGYFQSKNWLQDQKVFDSLFKLTAKDFATRDYYSKLAAEQRPILLHVRLTDYTSEVSFGLLAESYFRKAIVEISRNSLGSVAPNVWVFSDDIEAAKKLLNFLDPVTTTWFSEVEGCPAKTLEVMRMCSGYVISNSTFSWWAAALRYDQSSPVLYPAPWFKGAATPVELIPLEWLPVQAEWRLANSR